MVEPLSGAQCTLRAGDYVAEITSIGATLRALRYQGRIWKWKICCW